MPLKKLQSSFSIYRSSQSYKNYRFCASNPKGKSTHRTQTAYIPRQIRPDCFKVLATSELQGVYEPPKVNVKFIHIHTDFSGIKVHSFDQFFKVLQDQYTRNRHNLDSAPRRKLLEILSSSKWCRCWVLNSMLAMLLFLFVCFALGIFFSYVFF